jgi:hypothetical protein
MISLIILSTAGSIASIAGLCVSLYVLRKEKIIQKEVEELDRKETSRHQRQN